MLSANNIVFQSLVLSKGGLTAENAYLDISNSLFDDNRYELYLFYVQYNGSNSTIFATNGTEITISNNRFIKNAPIECG